MMATKKVKFFLAGFVGDLFMLFPEQNPCAGVLFYLGADGGWQQLPRGVIGIGKQVGQVHAQTIGDFFEGGEFEPVVALYAADCGLVHS